jgi:hypothetical protein
MSLSLNSLTSSNVDTSFKLHGKDFHILSQLESDSNKTFPIRIQEKIFKFTKEEIYLLSPKCYSDILESSLPFFIPLPSNNKYKNVPEDDLIKVFENIILLFSSLTQVQIIQSNVHVLQYLSEILENQDLESACRCFLQGQNQNTFFELSSIMFKNGSNKIKSSLHNFQIFVNNSKIKYNKVFFCCLSKTIFQSVLYDTSISEYHFGDIQNEKILISLFNIVFGESFQQVSFQTKKLLNVFV